MLSTIAIVLGLVIIISAVAADRSARAQRPFRAVILNLFGIGCLGLALVSLYAWANPEIRPSHKVAMVESEKESALMVQLVVGSDGRLEHFVATDSNDESIDEETEVEVEVEVKTEASQDEEVQAEIVAEDPSVTIELAELEEFAEDDEEEPLLGFDPSTAQVEIDFEARPDWVDQPDRDQGEVHWISVGAGPYNTVRKARKELSKQLKLETDEYLNEVVGHAHAARWIGYDEGEIRARFVGSDPERTFDEKIISPSFGVMHQSHALLEFGPAFHHEVQQNWDQVMARTQLVKMALAGGAVLGMLVMLFGYFNADTATRGFYSGRLKFVTALAILAVIGTGFLIARSIPWLWL